MKNNIDKDIERLENLIGFVGCELREIEAQSIENVLSRLKEYKDIEQDYIANEEKLADLISKLEKELETYKKIAEKLAEDLSKHIWLNDKEAIIKIYREKVEEDEVYS